MAFSSNWQGEPQRAPMLPQLIPAVVINAATIRKRFALMCYKYFMCESSRDQANVNFDGNNVDNMAEWKRGGKWEGERGSGVCGKRFVWLFAVGAWKAPLMLCTLLW